MVETMHSEGSPAAEVIERIGRAFPPAAPPGDEQLVDADADHLRACDECRDARLFFAGKTRKQVLADELSYPHLVNAFSFFTPPAWHYYLPAFLIQDVLSGRHRYDFFWHYDEPVVIKLCWPPRIALLDMPQCEAILAYLEFCRGYATRAGWAGELNKVVGWWQQVRREKLASDEWRV